MAKVLHGIGVSRGIARGKVRLVLSAGDFPSFCKGEVLVTTMTNPGMTSIMVKACAIICDIGGATSHASILARELGIPCVVATKNSTSELKNGIEVKVDGDRGEVTW